MSVVALPPEGTGVLEPRVELGIGPAELYVAVALVYTMAFLYLVTAAELSEDHHYRVHRTLVAGGVPLLLTFCSFVLYTSLTIV